MSFTNLSAYHNAVKDSVRFNKATITPTAGFWQTTQNVATYPASGIFTGAATTGTVPVAGNTGFPTIPTSALTHHILTKLEMSAVQAATPTSGLRFMLYDILWVSTTFAPNAAAQNYSGQASIAGRLPVANNYNNLEAWVMVNANLGTGAWTSIAMSYTNQDGTAKSITASTSNAQVFAASATAGRMLQMPLATGDTGLRTITQITPTSAASTGTLVAMITRPILMGTVDRYGNTVYDITRTGMPIIYNTSALALAFGTAAVATGVTDVVLELTSDS